MEIAADIGKAMYKGSVLIYANTFVLTNCYYIFTSNSVPFQ